MSDSRISARSARRHKARRLNRFRFLSFLAGVLVMLIIGTALLMNGHRDVTTSAQSPAESPAPAVTAMSDVTADPTYSPKPTATAQPTQTPAPSASTSPKAMSSTPDATPLSVTLNVKDKIEMKVGDTGQIRATLDPPDSSALLTWKSSDESVVKVNQKGKVKAVGAGTAKVGLWINKNEEASATVSIKVEKESKYVWIPRTGHKYHSNPNCSNMKNPKKVSLSEAIEMGYEKCSKCF